MSKITKEQYEFALARIEELLPMVDDNTPVNDRHAVELTMMSDVVIDHVRLLSGKIDNFRRDFRRVQFTYTNTLVYMCYIALYQLLNISINHRIYKYVHQLIILCSST